jgi:2-polyprenyl-6-hydroxyphenyl methylase/3-demethylubiquinone-9 3-methyltransferase
VLQRYGPKRIKRTMWNSEFANGRWTCLEHTPTDCVYPVLAKHAANGSILDLGCGPGNTGNEMDISSYRSYTGVDISDVALEKARHRTAESGRSDKNEYVQSDIFTYVPKKPYDVVLFGDSLYYIPYPRIPAMLERYSQYLTPNGVFIVRLFDVRGKHKAIVDAIEHHFDVLEGRLYFEQVYVIVFRARAASAAALRGRAS